jgi:hypothetical protein
MNAQHTTTPGRGRARAAAGGDMNDDAQRQGDVALASYVTIGRAAASTGLSEKAIRCKIAEGVWVENREWRRAPDGRLYISMRGYQQWVERGGK